MNQPRQEVSDRICKPPTIAGLTVAPEIAIQQGRLRLVYGQLLSPEDAERLVDLAVQEATDNRRTGDGYASRAQDRLDRAASADR